MKAVQMLWNTLNALAFNQPISLKQKNEMIQNLESGISTAYSEYEKIPQAEKDQMCIRIAQRMGCKSLDVNVCSKFIFDYSRS